MYVREGDGELLYKGSGEGCGVGLRDFQTLWFFSGRCLPGMGRGCAFLCLVLQQKSPSSSSQPSAGRLLCFLRSFCDWWWRCWRWCW